MREEKRMLQVGSNVTEGVEKNLSKGAEGYGGDSGLKDIDGVLWFEEVVEETKGTEVGSKEKMRV